MMTAGALACELSFGDMWESDDIHSLAARRLGVQVANIGKQTAGYRGLTLEIQTTGEFRIYARDLVDEVWGSIGSRTALVIDALGPMERLMPEDEMIFAKLLADRSRPAGEVTRTNRVPRSAR